MSSKVVPLFDPSRPRRERVPTERSQPSGVTPIFDPETQRIATLKALIAEMDSWAPLGRRSSSRRLWGRFRAGGMHDSVV
jgi:hypothetical protein